jgi:hypothetical protein
MAGGVYGRGYLFLRDKYFSEDLSQGYAFSLI